MIPVSYTHLDVYKRQVMDDTIGELLETQEHFSPSKAAAVRDCLLAAGKYGLAGLPLAYKVKFGWCMLRYKMTFADGVALYGKYVGNWGGEATRWRFDAVQDGNVVRSVTLCPSAKLHLEVESSRTALREKDTYDMAAVRVRILDENGTPAPYAQFPVQFTVEGSAALVGPQTAVAEGGMTGTYLRTVGTAGEALLTVSAPQTQPVVLQFTIEKEDAAVSYTHLYNFGEEDQFYIREHHEPIISEEVFEAAQEILRRRAKPRSLNVDGKREKFSRKYAFSCMIECGFCGGTLTRRSWHSSSQYNKAIWQCVVSTKKGKKFCPESKGVDERTIERAFVESYRLLCQNNKDVLDEFMKRTEETLSESNAGKRLAKAERDIHALEVKKNKLVDMRLEDTIDKETYDRKYLDLSSQIEQLQKECESLQDAAETESTMRKRVATFRQTLEQNEVCLLYTSWACSGVVSPGAKDCIRWWARLLPFWYACASSISNSISAVS